MAVDDTSTHGFEMKISDSNILCGDNVCQNKLLVDCGATSYIVCDADKFVSFHDNFDLSSYYIELADGSRSNNLLYGRGTEKNWNTLCSGIHLVQDIKYKILPNLKREAATCYKI